MGMHRAFRHISFSQARKHLILTRKPLCPLSPSQPNRIPNQVEQIQPDRVAAWFSGLAEKEPFDKLARLVPLFLRKSHLFLRLIAFSVPFNRACWLIQMTLRHEEDAQHAKQRQAAKGAGAGAGGKRPSLTVEITGVCDSEATFLSACHCCAEREEGGGGEGSLVERFAAF
jgi:hypothetical protein